MLCCFQDSDLRALSLQGLGESTTVCLKLCRQTWVCSFSGCVLLQEKWYLDFFSHSQWFLCPCLAFFGPSSFLSPPSLFFPQPSLFLTKPTSLFPLPVRFHSKFSPPFQGLRSPNPTLLVLPAGAGDGLLLLVLIRYSSTMLPPYPSSLLSCRRFLEVREHCFLATWCTIHKIRILMNNRKKAGAAAAASWASELPCRRRRTTQSAPLQSQNWRWRRRRSKRLYPWRWLLRNVCNEAEADESPRRGCSSSERHSYSCCSSSFFSTITKTASKFFKVQISDRQRRTALRLRRSRFFCDSEEQKQIHEEFSHFLSRRNKGHKKKTEKKMKRWTHFTKKT